MSKVNLRAAAEKKANAVNLRTAVPKKEVTKKVKKATKPVLVVSKKDFSKLGLLDAILANYDVLVK